MVELMIVIAIIGILAVTLIPAFSGMQNRAKDTGTINILQWAATAIDAWKTDVNPVQMPHWTAARNTQIGWATAMAIDNRGAERWWLAAYANSAAFSSLKKDALCLPYSSRWGSSLTATAGNNTLINAPTVCGSNSYSVGYIPARSVAGVSTPEDYLIWAVLLTNTKRNSAQIQWNYVSDNNTPTYLYDAANTYATVPVYSIHGATRR